MPVCLSVSRCEPPTDPTERGTRICLSVCLPTQASHFPQAPSNHASCREGPQSCPIFHTS